MGHGRVRRVSGTKMKMSKFCRGRKVIVYVPYFSIRSYSIFFDVHSRQSLTTIGRCNNRS